MHGRVTLFYFSFRIDQFLPALPTFKDQMEIALSGIYSLTLAILLWKKVSSPTDQ